MRKAIILAAVLLGPAAALGALSTVQRAREAVATPSPVLPVAYASVAAAPAVTPAPAPAPLVPDLPTVQVEQRVVHAAPSDADTAPPKPFTILPLEGKLAERSLPRAPRAPRAMSVSLEPAMVSGPADATGGDRLGIDGQTISLFGVKLAAHDDGAAARAALAQRLAAAPSVHCAAPPGQTRALRFVCRDGAGVDLGELLVSQGLVVADRSSSYQYVGDEEAARSRRLGVWRGR